MRHAFTLLELTLVLSIAGVLFALALPRLAHVRDVSSVRAAVAEVGGAFALARQEAIVQRALVGVLIDGKHGVVEVRSRRGAIIRRALGDVYGVVLAANRDSIVYDARGLGYGVSNLTVTVRRGSIVDTLTMSRLGRVRW